MGRIKRPKIVIEGVTLEGKTFRPSDWAERVSGVLSTFKNQRIYYSPLLKPTYLRGHRSVIVDMGLKESHPELYEHIIDFAHANRLLIRNEDGTPLAQEMEVKKNGH